MAPGMIEPLAFHTLGEHVKHHDDDFKTQLLQKKAILYKPGQTQIENHEHYEHQDLLPRFPKVHWEPIPILPYADKALRGHPQFRNLLSQASDVFDYNPKIGTEINGINLATLTGPQKDDLALLVSIRGVVFFRNQADLDIDSQRDFSRYYGTLHKHATTSVPQRAGLEDVHVVYTDEKSKDQRANFAPSFLWHSDVSL